MRYPSCWTVLLNSETTLNATFGPGSFLFHLGRVSDAMESILYAVNEYYDPATKRSELSWPS